MSRFREAFRTSQRREFRTLHHFYYYCSAEERRSTPHRIPTSPDPNRALPRAPPPATPPPPRPHAQPRPLLLPRQGTHCPREPPPAPANQQHFGGGASGPSPPIWAPTGRYSRRLRGRAPHPPSPFSSTLPFRKKRRLSHGVCQRRAGNGGARKGERGKEGLQGDRG